MANDKIVDLEKKETRNWNCMSDNNKHKFTKNNRYFTISIYVILTVCVSTVVFKAIWDWNGTLNTIANIIDVLSPYLIGILIAYLMNPLVMTVDKWIFGKLFRIKKDYVRKLLSILLVYIVVLGIIVVCISIIVPEIYSSLKSIYEGIQESYDKFLKFLDTTSKKHPDWDISYISNLAKDNSSNIIDFVQGSVNTVLPLLYNTSISVISWAINILIAIMVSCYLLIDKERMLLNFKRLIFAVAKKEKAEKFIRLLGDCNKIFSSFVVGKTIDSVIIGFMCFLFMKILNLDYAMLISVIVGITNMIPYFGPFIGAIPAILILLTKSFNHALIFAVMIFILQQFDGIYLGPKILGESIGLRPVWIIFGITIGGWLAGPIGMFLGVPCIGVIGFLIENFINRKLKEKSIVLNDNQEKNMISEEESTN